MHNNDCQQQWLPPTMSADHKRGLKWPTKRSPHGSDRQKWPTTVAPPVSCTKEKMNIIKKIQLRVGCVPPAETVMNTGHLGTWTLDTGHCHETGHAGTNWNQPRFKELVGTSSPLARPKGSLSFFLVSHSIPVKSQPLLDQDQYTYIIGCVQPMYRLTIGCTRNRSAQPIMQHDALMYFQVILFFLPN